MNHILYLVMLQVIYTIKTSVPLEKLFRKNLQSAQLIESATQNRISFGLPNYLTPKLVQLCKDVTIYRRALNKVNFSGTLATKCLWNSNIEKSKGYWQDAKVSFCEHRLVNASNTIKVFSILASYFDDQFGKSVVQHYKSLECIYFNAEVRFSEI